MEEKGEDEKNWKGVWEGENEKRVARALIIHQNSIRE